MKQSNADLHEYVKALGFEIIYFDGKPYVKTEDGEMVLDLFIAITNRLLEQEDK